MFPCFSTKTDKNTYVIVLFEKLLIHIYTWFCTGVTNPSSVQFTLGGRRKSLTKVKFSLASQGAKSSTLRPFSLALISSVVYTQTHTHRKVKWKERVLASTSNRMNITNKYWNILDHTMSERWLIPMVYVCCPAAASSLCFITFKTFFSQIVLLYASSLWHTHTNPQNSFNEHKKTANNVFCSSFETTFTKMWLYYFSP